MVVQPTISVMCMWSEVIFYLKVFSCPSVEHGYPIKTLGVLVSRPLQNYRKSKVGELGYSTAKK